MTYTTRQKILQFCSWSSWCFIPHQYNNIDLVVEAVELEKTHEENSGNWKVETVDNIYALQANETLAFKSVDI